MADGENAKGETEDEERVDGKMYKKETGEFVFDGGGNIDTVLGTVEKETRHRAGKGVAYKERRVTKIEP